MRSTFDIEALLDELTTRPADELEDQDLDFKEWRSRSMADAVNILVEIAVCMANGGGGTVVLGVNDKAIGRINAISGVPTTVDINQLKRTIYDRTDPKLTVVFEEISVPEGSKRILVMQVLGGTPPYIDSSGAGKIRVGTECKPLTGTTRRHLTAGSSDEDLTAVGVPGDPAMHLSAAAMERLRDTAILEHAPDELLRLSDLEHGMFHFEYRTYPEIALREALMNALCHADYSIASPILIRQYPRYLEIGNPGGLIGGITPDNILHHRPLARNPLLVEALTRLRLINRSNLGISRMFSAMLIEGKEPPIIQGEGKFVKVRFSAGEISASFRVFVAEESSAGRLLSVDHLLILHYLLRHPEMSTSDGAIICQRAESDVREILSEMEREREHLERGGHGKGAYWSLRPDLHQRLAAPGHPDRNRQLDWEAAKTRVLSILKQRAERGEPGLTNKDVRQITHLDRYRVKRLIHELEEEGGIVMRGRGRGAQYRYER